MNNRNALSREAIKLLMTLSRRNARIVRQEAEGDTEAACETFMVTRGSGTAGRGKSQHVSCELVLSLQKEQLIAPNNGGFVLSETGRAFLRRNLARADAFRQQHQQRAIEATEIEGVRKPAVVDETESPLGWLRRRKDKTGQPLIDAAQFAAGERLRADFHYAGLMQRVTASWDGIPGDRASRRAGPGASTDLREQTVAAQQRVRRALDAVGPDLASILVDVCCHLKGLEEAERENAWPRRSAKLVLQIALKELARHYGLIQCATDAARNSSQGLLHWGAVDYKPRMQEC